MIGLIGCQDRLADAFEHARVARSLLENGNVPAAKREIGQALQYAWDQPEILLLDAQIKLRSGDLYGAFEGFRSVLAIAPGNRDALLSVAQLGLASGDRMVARDAIARLLAANPRDADALLAKGVDAIGRKDYAEALNLGDTILAAEPDDRRGIILKARALSLLGKSAEAKILLGSAAERLGNDELMATVQLENARDKGDASAMMEQIPVLRQQRPDSIDLAIDETNIRYKSGDLAGGRRTGFEALQQFGTDVTAVRRLVSLWEEYDTAPLDANAQSWLITNGTVTARVAVARFYLGNNESEVAEQLVSGSRDVRALALQARIGVEQDKPGIITSIASILTQDKTNCDALAAAAEWNLKGGNAPEATKTAQVVAAQCPDIREGYILLARSYAVQKRVAGVERAYMEGLSAQPANALLVHSYIAWLLDQKNPRAAIAAARQLVQVVPAKASGWALLEDVCRKASDLTCAAEAQRGRVTAQRNYAIDLPPGEFAINPLLGRKWN